MWTHWGFFRRASESRHNNFAIYCGLVMVRCRCYIGLECTILFSSEPTQWVVGHYGHCPTGDFDNKARWLGLDGRGSCPFWRRTFLRWLCQHFDTATSFIKKYDWQSGHWISPQCFPKFYPTNCPVEISKVSSTSLKKQVKKDANVMINMKRKILFFPLLIAIRPQFVIDHECVRLKNNPCSVAVCPIHPCEWSL